MKCNKRDIKFLTALSLYDGTIKEVSVPRIRIICDYRPETQNLLMNRTVAEKRNRHAEIMST